jgi:putative transcriptional regulator
MKTIRELREAQGWTQLEVAFKLGVTPLTVSNWERGKYEPSASKLRQIAQLFKISMDEIELMRDQGKAAA